MTNFCTSGMALLQAGKNVSEDFYSGMHLLRFPGGEHVIDHMISGACTIINNIMKVNFMDNYETLSSDTKLILEQGAAAIVAIDMVKYNMDSYTSRVEAEDIINVNRDTKLMILSLLRDKKNQGFILRPTAGSA